jgi:hypothetical protein
MRARAVVLGLLVARLAGADPETPQLTHSEIDRENQIRLRADQQKLEDVRMELVRARREKERAAELRHLDEDEWNRKRDVADHGRSVGVGLGVTAGVFGVLAGVAAYLGTDVNNSIKSGGYATPRDINDAIDRGKIYNYVGIGTGIAAGVFALAATAKILFNLDPGDYEVSPAVGAQSAGLSITGRF